MPSVVKSLQFDVTRAYSGEVELCHQPVVVNSAPALSEETRLTEVGLRLAKALWAVHGVERLLIRRYTVEVTLSAAVAWSVAERDVDLIVEEFLGAKPVWDEASQRKLSDVATPQAQEDVDEELKSMLSGPPQ